MDRVQGELLIYKVKECQLMERKMLIDWMVQLLHQLQCYQRCHNGRNYRYVNPYSVLIARDGKILLLDLEAESNEFVMKNMQKRAMRRHFVRPVLNIMNNSDNILDIYGYGKTVQFMLANTKVEPALTRYQGNRLEKMINKCLSEETKKQYEDLRQIEKDLFFISETKERQGRQKILLSVATGFLAVMMVCALFVIHSLKTEQKELQVQLWKLEQQEKAKEEEVLQENNGQTEPEAGTQETAEGSLEMSGAQESLEENDLAGEASVSDASNQQQEAEGSHGEDSENSSSVMEQQTADGNTSEQQTAAEGKRVDIVDENGTTENAEEPVREEAALSEEQMRELLTIYDQLIVAESQEELLKAAYFRKIALEAELLEIENAKETADEFIERFPDYQSSEEFLGLLDRYHLTGNTEE
ncbi:MAG: hypothetical protein J5983_07010 [Ruminococcus sp.]|nr:hypothetical protein [Ruminococcus sp.]